VHILTRRLAALAFVLLAPAAHAQGALVFAASSLKEALDEVAGSFAAGRAGRVDVSYAASSVLARQITRGAPADIFISADTDWVDYVEQQGAVVAGSRRNLLANELVLVAPAASEVKLKLVHGIDLASSLGKGRLAMADPQAVPAGKYGKAALTAMGAWKGVEGRVAAAENVRAALALVARGEAPLGIVYRTDALAEKGVRIVDTFPAASHPPIVYPVVVLRRSSTPVATAFAGYLATPEARAIFERHGFRAP
jgi:molybdate transport system substrate-binding protein